MSADAGGKLPQDVENLLALHGMGALFCKTHWFVRPRSSRSLDQGLYLRTGAPLEEWIWTVERVSIQQR